MARADGGLLDMARELAVDLHQVGALSKATLREIEALAIPDVPEFTAAQIRAIREKNQVSQAVFAKIMNVGPSTVAQWEQGKKKPGGASARLLDILMRKGVRVVK